jgi:predicted O-methyltransferase YrrM
MQGPLPRHLESGNGAFRAAPRDVPKEELMNDAEAKIFDAVAGSVLLALRPLLTRLAKLGNRAPLSRSILDRFNIALVQHHYYVPVMFPADLNADLVSAERTIPGIKWNEEFQLDLIRQFTYRDELIAIPIEQTSETEFSYHNQGWFESGDAEFLYNMIRYFKPCRIIEIGAGYSTLMARIAIQANANEDANYHCEHICIEPFERPWLESIPVKVVRERIETCATECFRSLKENDILFIDSSHVIRPQGDVVYEYLYLLGLLQPGVIIHAHDIFTPRDYPAQWILDLRRLWDEQYLLEAFLCFNSEFEIVAAVNWLSHNHRDRLTNACPILMQEPHREPASFWFRRVAK